jgi:hypothetical protein
MNYDPEDKSKQHKQNERNRNSYQIASCKLLQRLESFAIAKTHRNVVCDITRQATIHEKSTKCDDERLNSKFCDQISMHGTDKRRQNNNHQYSNRPGYIPTNQQHAQYDPGQSKDRSNGEVDAACNDYKSATNAENSENANQPGNILKIGCSQKIRVPYGNRDTQENKHQKYAQLFFHLATF